MRDLRRIRVRRSVATALVCILALAALTGCQARDESHRDALDERETVDVVRVVDGDTINIHDEHGQRERVRIIGIDTPEINHDGGRSECWAHEAHEMLEDIIDDRPVELVYDPSQGDRDEYDRLLRHVLVDGRSVAMLLIRAGAGTEFTFEDPYAGHDAHVSAERQARDDRLGVWGNC